MAKANKSPKEKLQKKITSKQSSYIPEILVLILTMGVFVYLCLQLSFIQDDAYISFRYVKNFVEGNGLVFNAGERVEGYTNFLWVVLLSAFALVKINIELISQILSVAFGSLNIILVFLIAQSIKIIDETGGKPVDEKTKKYFDLVPSVMTAFTGAYAFWAVSGMETSMFIFFLLLSIYFYLHPKDKKGINSRLGISLLLASLTRPEGIILAGFLYLHKFIWLAINRKGIENPKRLLTKTVLPEIAVFALPYLAYILFRFIYYGYFLPNTFYAKTGFSMVYIITGIDYVFGFAKAYLLYGIIALCPLLLLQKKMARFEVTFLLGFVFLYSFYVVFVGGDVLQLYRFMLPVLPLFFILWSLFLYSLILLIPREKKIFNLTAYFLIAVSVGIAMYNYLGAKNEIERIQVLEINLVEKMRIQAKWFEDEQLETGKNVTVALSTIGAFSYFSNTTVIDLLGLTDSNIAHNPVEQKEISGDSSVGWKERHYNAAYILKRKPDFILFSTGQKPSAFAERALFAEEDFFKYYYIQYIYLPDLKAGLVVYTRKKEEHLAKWKNLQPNPGYSVKFIGSYIEALNILSKYYSTRDKEYFGQLIEKSAEVVKYKPAYFADIYRVLGEAYTIAGDYQNAESSFLRVLELDEANALVSLGLSRLYERIKSPLAEKYRQLALKYSPNIIN